MGNFLVIAYIRMREIEDEIVRRRGEALERSAISLTQFYGIEIKSFAAEIARQSLLIAELQCDMRFIGQAEARALVLPLYAMGTIVTGNALRLDWEEVCPPVAASVEEEDLGGPTGWFDLEGGGEGWEMYICGNPPYLGSTWQSRAQKAELKAIFGGRTKSWRSLGYVAGWLMKAIDYRGSADYVAAFVSTNSISQGQQVPILWPLILSMGTSITFARTSFKWSNSANHNAGVTVVIVGISRNSQRARIVYSDSGNGVEEKKVAANINPYLVARPDNIVEKRSKVLSGLPEMILGNKVVDGGHLRLDNASRVALRLHKVDQDRFTKKTVGGQTSLTVGSSIAYGSKIRRLPK